MLVALFAFGLAAGGGGSALLGEELVELGLGVLVIYNGVAEGELPWPTFLRG